ncbi:MAG: hypothetical protein DME60_03205 [Verrucomicrobia bacterium]|nr:MAG: hypothetical protein DME60_03205 [Verrucomicrobiota bacterium]
MPPAYIYRLETSPRMISQFGSFTSFQVNVDANGNNIVGDAANEPSITVNPTDLSKMAIGWRQFDSVNSDFRQGGYGYTTNSGATWTFPGVLESNVFRSDPVLSSNETGTFFYLSLLQSFCDNVWSSTNFGQSWTRLQPDGAAGGGDKEWFTIDKTSGIGHGFQYQTWSTAATCGGGQFSRSTNGGVTWMNPISVPNSPVWGTLDVDTNGNLFIGGGNFGSQFWCVRSSNAQNGGVTPTFDRVTSVNLGGSVWFGAPINVGGLAGQIFLAVDRSGTATNNNIYMLATVLPTGASNGTDVMFSRSTDGGLTFSAPHRINDDPINHNKWHWFGTLSVAPNGRIDSVWLDTRNAANNTDSQLFYSFSTDGGLTWAANVAVSDAFNPFEGYPVQQKIGDYITIVSDNTGGNVAYAATFNFNPSRGQHEEDVYYVRVAPPSSVLTLLSAASRLTHAGAGTFDVPMPLSGVSGVEDRSSATYNAVFTFDGAVTSGQVTVLSGTATVGTISFSGNSMTAPLTGVTSAEIVTLRVQNINGDGQLHGDIPFGFLTADVNANRIVDRPDQQQLQTDRGQPVTASNFRDDINLSGVVDRPDVQSVQTNRGHSIP